MKKAAQRRKGRRKDVNQMFYGEKPEGAVFYHKDGNKELIVWGPPPIGDKLCIGLTGCTEAQLVRDILDGKYNHILNRARQEQE